MLLAAGGLSLCKLSAQQPLQGFNPPPPPSTLRLFTTNDVLGSYQRTLVLGSTNLGSIIAKPGSPALLLWTNHAGNAWTLAPDFTHQLLGLGADSPFNGQNFTLIQSNGVCTGFYGPGDPVPYTNSAPIPTFGSATYHGYTVSSVATGDASTNWGAGFSFYSATWGMLDKPLAGFQVGQVGTWLQPDNRDDPYPVLPTNSSWVINNPSSNPRAWDGLYQTIEGSPGSWVSTEFPSTSPKYRMNGTYDAYGHQLSSPGWGFGGGGPAQPTNVMGIAQFSNRILTPPDGFTFANNPNGAFVGYAWMALPMIPARNLGTTNTVGDQSWTFFINTTNFSGPIGFYVPDIYTRYALQTYTNDIGRGMDVRPGRYVPFASEWGEVPMLIQTNGTGNIYGRIPRLLFPTNGAGLSYLASDACVYSKSALFTPVQNWFGGGAAIAGTFNTDANSMLPQPVAVDPSFGGAADNWYQYNVNLNGVTANVYGLDSFVQKAAPTTPGAGSAFALQWASNSTAGVYPEYLLWVTNGWTVISRSQLPAEVFLPYASFTPAGTGGAYTSATSWNTPAPNSTNSVVTLSDGSQVTYAWYRFIDQPSLQGFGWSDAQRQQLQSRVEQLQAAWSTNRNFMPPPSSGVLAALDTALLVTPPPGMEVGYVPIVINQTATATTGPAPNYLDLNGSSAGFGNINGVTTNFGTSTTIWTSDATGVAAPVAFANGKSIVIGNGNNALAGALTLTPTANQYLTGLAILDAGVNLTLNGTANFYLGGGQTWNVAAGSTLTENITLQEGNATSVGMNMGFGANTMTLAGGGTMNFITALGLNGSAGGLILENDPSLTVNLYAAGVGPTGWGSAGTHGFELRNGRLNLASANGANAFAKLYTNNTFRLGGGSAVLDNTSGGPQAMSIGGAGNNGIVINGNFTFAGSNPLTVNAGTNGVTLTTTPCITVTNTLTLAGVLSGASGLTKAGPGTLVLGSNNAYLGNTTIKAGTLALGSGGGIGSSASIVISSGATFDVSAVSSGYTLGWGAAQTLGGSGNVNGAVTVGPWGTIAAGTGSSMGRLTLNNTLSLGGTVTMKLSKTGGVITNDQISGVSSLTFGGTLIVANITSDGSALAPGDTFTLFRATNCLAQFNTILLPALPGNWNLVWDTTHLASSGAIALAASTVQPAFNPAAGTYLGPQTVTIGSATGGATIYYSTDGTTPTTNSPSGASPVTVLVPAGTNLTLRAYAASAGLPDSAVASAAYQTFSVSTWSNAAGGSWMASGNWSNGVVADGVGVVAELSRLTLGANRTITLDGVPTVAQLVCGDAGNRYGWTVTNGTGGPLTLNAGAATPVITVNNRTNTIGAALAGTNGLIKAGSGTLMLNGTNTYSGGINVTNGTLTLASTAAQPASGTIAISTGATVNLSASGSPTWPVTTVTGSGTLVANTIGGGTVDLSSCDLGRFTGVLDVTGSGGSCKLTVNPPFVSPAAGATLKVENGTTAYLGWQGLSLGCNVELDGPGNNEGYGALRVELNAHQNGPVLLKTNSSIGGASGAGYIGGVIGDNGSGYGFTKLQNGTIVLQAANTFTGDTVVSAGALQLANALALQYSSANLSGAANGLLFTPGLGTFTLGGLKGNQNLSLQDTSSGPVTVRAGNNNASTTYGGLLSGGGGLAKIGTGTLTLSGAHTYSGPTTAGNGTLTINGSLAAASGVTVQPGAILAGRGVVNGAVLVQPGAALAPGTNGIGSLTLGNLDLGGNMLVAVNGATNGSVSVNGTLTNRGTGTIIVTNLGPTITAGRSFKLFNAPLPNGGALTVTPPPAAGLAWSNWLAVDGTIRVVSTSATTLQAALEANQLTLTWPPDHTGWRLQSQTNPPSAGLGTNWSTVPGSPATNRMQMPIAPGQGSVFYRLVYP